MAISFEIIIVNFSLFYIMFRFLMALRDITTSLSDFLNERNDKYIGRMANNGNV